MTEQQWNAVDRYFCEHLLPADPVLEAALAASEAAGLPSIQVAPNQGKLLKLLAEIQGARRILEIGTLAGYSTIWLARALPTAGRVVTLEVVPRHAEVARQNFERAGLTNLIELRLGAALDTLAALVEERQPAFDLVFVDADKENIPEYYEWALKLSRPGTIIVIDNVVRSGRVLDGSSSDPNIRGIRRFIEERANDPRVSATAVQTVGSKGYDGFALLRVSG